MKTLLIALIVLAFAVTAPKLVCADGCTTHTYTYNGRMIICTTCCYFGNCNTNCF